MTTLLSDVVVSEAAVWTAVAGAVAAIIGAAATAAVKIYSTRHQLTAEDRKDAIEEYRKLARIQEGRIKRLEDRDEAFQVEMDKIARDHQDCLVKNAALVVRLEHYEDALRNAGIKFRALDDTGNHPPVAGGGT